MWPFFPKEFFFFGWGLRPRPNLPRPWAGPEHKWTCIYMYQQVKMYVTTPYHEPIKRITQKKGNTMLWLINWQKTLVAKDRPNYDLVPKTNPTSKRTHLTFIKLNRAIQLSFDESHKGSLKQHLYQEAKKNSYDEYQDSILANKKAEKETTFESSTEWIQGNQY